jgi:hypothetical protein
MRPSPRPRSTRRARADLEFALRTVARPNPAVVAWRWRYELGLAAGLPTGILVLAHAVGTGWALAAVSALSGVLAGWPAARRLAIARAWCVITPHRVRTGCAQSWIHSRSGKIPIVLLTTSEPFGERVHLWCRAGTGPDDLIWARPLLAAACWAADVQVVRHERFAQLAALDVIRSPGAYLPGGPEEDRWRSVTELPPAEAPSAETTVRGSPATRNAHGLTSDPATGEDEPGHAA